MPEVFIAIAVVLVIMMGFYYSRKRKVNKILTYLNALLANNKDPDLFLSEMDGYIRKHPKRIYKTILIILKSKGLIWKGMWEECLDNLRSVDPKDILNDFNRVMYHYYWTFSLFNLDRENEALSYIAENQAFLDSCLKKPVSFIANPAKKMFALQSYYTGDLQKAKGLFTELDLLQKDDFSKAVNLYYLGMIAKNTNDAAAAEEAFAKAADLGRTTYLPDLISKARGAMK